MAKHLIGAIRDYLRTVPSLGQALRGGIADSAVDRDRALPYLILQARDLQSIRTFGDGEVQFIRVEFSVFAQSRERAEEIGNQVRDLILPPAGAPAWRAILISGGWKDRSRYPSGGDVIELDADEKAARGNDVWACRRPITWTISR